MIASNNHPINCGLVSTESFSRSFSKQTISDRSINIVYNYIDRIIEESNSEIVNVADTKFLRTSDSVFVKDIELIVSNNSFDPQNIKSTQSLNNSIFAPTTNPLLFSHAGNGSCVLELKLTNGETYAQKVFADTYSNETSDVFAGFVDGSAIHQITNETEALLTEENSPLSHYAYYSVYNGTQNSFQRNNGCWFSDFDLSGVCVKTGGGNTRMCSMISPSFAVGCQHFNFHPQIGETVVFVTPENQAITRTVESVSYLNDDPINELPSYDISIIKFTQPVPENIKKYKFFPSNENRRFGYIPFGTFSFASMAYMPIISISHYRWDSEYPLARNNRFVFLRRTTFSLNGSPLREDLVQMGMANSVQQGALNLLTPSVPEGRPLGRIASHVAHPLFPNYNAASSGIRGGDSGGPSFAILNGEPVLFCIHWSAFVAMCFGGVTNLIQQKMDEMGANNETVEIVDLSEFTQFDLPLT